MRVEVNFWEGIVVLQFRTSITVFRWLITFVFRIYIPLVGQTASDRVSEPVVYIYLLSKTNSHNSLYSSHFLDETYGRYIMEVFKTWISVIPYRQHY